MVMASSCLSRLRSRTPMGCGTSACEPSRTTPERSIVNGVSLEGVGAVFASANSSDVVYRNNPDLAVTDLAGLSGGHDSVRHSSGIGVLDEDLKTSLGNQVDGVLS